MWPFVVWMRKYTASCISVLDIGLHVSQREPLLCGCASIQLVARFQTFYINLKQNFCMKTKQNYFIKLQQNFYIKCKLSFSLKFR